MLNERSIYLYIGLQPDCNLLDMNICSCLVYWHIHAGTHAVLLHTHPDHDNLLHQGLEQIQLDMNTQNFHLCSGMQTYKVKELVHIHSHLKIYIRKSFRLLNYCSTLYNL